MRSIAVAAVALASCLAPAPVVRMMAQPDVQIETPVWIDARFSRAQKDAIERAMGTWNRALGGQERFFVASEDMLVPEFGLVHEARNALGWGVTFEYDDVKDPKDFPGEAHLAEVLHSNNVAFYPKVFSTENYGVVALHEFGHIMGLNDNQKGSSLMSSPYNDERQRCVDVGSLRAIAKDKHWDLGKMSVQCVL